MTIPPLAPIFWLSILSFSPAAGAPLLVPGSTAYSMPDPHGLQIGEADGVKDWRDPAPRVVWFGRFSTTGWLTAKLKISLPEGRTSHLKLTIGDTVQARTIEGRTTPLDVDFGSFTLTDSGYQKLVLENLNAAGEPAGGIIALELDGPALEGAHFNLEPRRNAASVHLKYSVHGDVPITAFYNEVTAVEDPVHTYYMACGFTRGYLGMQVNSKTERRIIFSVWDAGNGTDARDRTTVSEALHTTLLAKGEGVDAGVFGNEGTGGHSHFVYPWKTGEAQKFVVTAQAQGSFTNYAGYWFHPEKKQWKLLARFHAPLDGKFLRGLYSFSENFVGETGHLVRKARYGNQWIQTSNSNWTELTTAAFSHDSTGKEARLDRFMGIEDDQFFLSHGGFVDGFTQYGESFTRPGGGNHPDVKLPIEP